MELTQSLARFVAGVRYKNVPPAVVDQTKLLLLDLLGVAIRGSVGADSSGPLDRAYAELVPGAGPCTAVGHDRTYPAHYAALINATYAHSLDFDDTHAGGSLHPGATVIPAALAAGEAANISGKEFLTAIVAGYEVCCRLSEALPASSHYDRGFHPTATTGSFAAAAAATVVADGTAADIANAWGITLSFTSGTFQFTDNGAWNKRFQVGFAAHNGIVAATLNRHGVLGASRPLEGVHGFLQGYSNRPAPDKLLAGLGEEWKVLETGIKPYPCCRYMHSSLDGLVALHREGMIRADQVDSLQIGMCRKGFDLVGTPAERKRETCTVVDGQFSMHYGAAIAMTRGRMTWDDYDQLEAPEIRQLMQKIEVVIDPEAEANYPKDWSARLRIDQGGHQIERFILRPKGEPELPLSWAEVTEKFHSLAEAVFDPNRRNQIIQAVRQLDALASVQSLALLLRP